MTLIGAITIDVPVLYSRSGYNTSMAGSFNDSVGFNELREMYAKAIYGTAIHPIAGGRPFGEDLTETAQNTQYVQITEGLSGKSQNGYYLLRGGYTFAEDESPEGHSYVWKISLFFLGTSAYYQDAYALKSLAAVSSEWGI